MRLNSPKHNKINSFKPEKTAYLNSNHIIANIINNVQLNDKSLIQNDAYVSIFLSNRFSVKKNSFNSRKIVINTEKSVQKSMLK